jgi:hypothetical protein
LSVDSSGLVEKVFGGKYHDRNRRGMYLGLDREGFPTGLTWGLGQKQPCKPVALLIAGTAPDEHACERITAHQSVRHGVDGPCR